MYMYFDFRKNKECCYCITKRCRVYNLICNWQPCCYFLPLHSMAKYKIYFSKHNWDEKYNFVNYAIECGRMIYWFSDSKEIQVEGKKNMKMKLVRYWLFRNKRFALNEMFQSNSSVKFINYKKTLVFFSFCATLFLPLFICPGRHS